MSSYGGGNGVYYNFYPELCINPPLNVLNVTTNPIIIKCESGAVEAQSMAASTVVKCEESIEKLKPIPQVKEENRAHAVNTENANETIASQGDSNEGSAPEVDIIVNNVVCSFNVRCHLNLRQIALNGANVEYKRENGMVTMKIRRPYTTASIWSSGKITCTGATSDEDAKAASRKVARKLQQLGFRVKFTNFRVVNVLCTCFMYFGINLIKFAEKHRKLASYEPELHPGLTYKVKELKATLKIFTTGSITVTAPSITNAQLAVEHIFPLVYEFKTALPPRKPKQPLCPPIIPVNHQKIKCSNSDDELDESEEDCMDTNGMAIDSDSDEWE